MTTRGMALPAYPKRSAATSFRQIADEGGLVVIPGRSEVKVLNPVAILVFSLLDGQHSVEEIVRQVTDEFEIGPEAAREDVLDFLNQLADHGMLIGFEA